MLYLRGDRFEPSPRICRGVWAFAARGGVLRHPGLRGRRAQPGGGGGSAGGGIPRAVDPAVLPQGQRPPGSGRATLAARGWGANVVSSGEWRRPARGGRAAAADHLRGRRQDRCRPRWRCGDAVEGDPVRWVALESAAEAGPWPRSRSRHGLGHGGLPGLDILLRLNPQVEPGDPARPRRRCRQQQVRDGRGRRSWVWCEAVSGRPGLRVRGIHVHVGSDLGDVSAWADAGGAAPYACSGGDLGARRAGPTPWTSGRLPLRAGRRAGPLPSSTMRSCGGSPTRGARASAPTGPSSRGGSWSGRPAGWWARVLRCRPRRAVRPAGGARRRHDRADPPGALREPPSGARPRPRRGRFDTLLGDRGCEGPVCESTDSFGLHVLPALDRGDLVAVARAGAYAASFTSRYNGRPHPAEVMLGADGSLESCARVNVERPARTSPG